MVLTKNDLEEIFKSSISSIITYIEKTNFDKDKKYNHNFCTLEKTKFFLT